MSLPSYKILYSNNYAFSVFIAEAMLINLTKDMSAATNADAAFKMPSNNFSLSTVSLLSLSLFPVALCCRVFYTIYRIYRYGPATYDRAMAPYSSGISPYVLHFYFKISAISFMPCL